MEMIWLITRRFIKYLRVCTRMEFTLSEARGRRHRGTQGPPLWAILLPSSPGNSARPGGFGALAALAGSFPGSNAPSPPRAALRCSDCEAGGVARGPHLCGSRLLGSLEFPSSSSLKSLAATLTASLTGLLQGCTLGRPQGPCSPAPSGSTQPGTLVRGHQGHLQTPSGPSSAQQDNAGPAPGWGLGDRGSPLWNATPSRDLGSICEGVPASPHGAGLSLFSLAVTE